MITIHLSSKGTPYVFASELRVTLDVQTPLNIWITSMSYGFIEGKDYAALQNTEDWFIKLDMAQNIALLQRTEAGKSLRQYLVTTAEEYQAGKLLNKKQMKGLIELVKVLGYFSMQEHLEKKHFDFFGKPNAWWDYRAKLLGYSSKDLKEAVESVGKKYKNQRQAVIITGRKYHLVRAAIIDLFVALGKSQMYAINLADAAMLLAEEMQIRVYDDTGISIDFKTEEEHQAIHLLKVDKHPILLDF